MKDNINLVYLHITLMLVILDVFTALPKGTRFLWVYVLLCGGYSLTLLGKIL